MNFRQRTILSSGRIVKTIEEKYCFWVVRPREGPYPSVSGPFPLNDTRFSDVISSETSCEIKLETGK